MAVLRATVFSILAATLGGCGGGGGSGGGSGAPAPIGNPPPPPSGQQPQTQQPQTQQQQTQQQTTPRTDVAFSSFSAVQPNQNAIMSGTGTTISGKMSNGVVTSINVESIGGPVTLTPGLDGQRSLTALTIKSIESNVSFDRALGHNISCGGGPICAATSPTASAAIGDAQANGWNYQTYGVWAVASNPTSFLVGAASAGNATPGNAVPTTGTATFTGNASGYFIDTAGTRFTTGAAMIANVDFQNRAIGFTTIDTTAVNSNTGAASMKGELDLSGTLTYAAGVNNFSGPVGTANHNMAGNASGRFYGPTAQEIGGTYLLQNGATSRMVGGFGGKR